MPENDDLELYGEDGTKVLISAARLKRYPSLAAAFRPMSEKKTTAPVVEQETETLKEN